MTALLLTGWHGTLFAKMAAHTVPLMDAYAALHGMHFCCVNLHGVLPPSWMKIPFILKALQHHACVVWIDSDVVIVDGAVNICDDVPAESWQAVVEHETSCGCVPNCGVWVCRQQMRDVLQEIWSSDKRTTHPWWEQSAVLERMGYEVTDAPHASLSQPTELYERTTFLGAEWNDHPHDSRRCGSPRFVHVTQYADRVEEVIRLAGCAK